MDINEKKLGEIYKDEFLDLDKNRDLAGVMDRIIKCEKQFDKDCTRWNIDEVEHFLRSLNSVSPNSLSRSIIYLRNFAKFICEKENLQIPRYKLDHGRLYDLVDYDILLKTVISPKEYKLLVTKLYNVRDRVIFHLAWLGLNADEIKNLKESDVQFKTSNESGLEMALIKIHDFKTFKTQDPIMVDDVKKCINDGSKYLVEGKGKKKKYKEMELKESKYLIKPVSVGRGKNDKIGNPSISLQHAIMAQNINHPIIDTSKLNIEAIKRSKLIFLLSPENEKFFDKEYIKNIFGSENEATLFWYKKIAKIKYATKEEESLLCSLEN